MTRIFMNVWFAKFARKNRISNEVLADAVVRADLGLVDADLGSGVIKQRIARNNMGKSGGFRSVIIFKRGEIAIFVFGYAKNDLGSLDDIDLSNFRRSAKLVLEFSDADIKSELKSGRLLEVRYGKAQIQK